MKLYVISLLIFLLSWETAEGGFWSGPPRPMRPPRGHRPHPGHPGPVKPHGHGHGNHHNLGNVNLQGAHSTVNSQVLPAGNQKFSHHPHPHPGPTPHHRGRPPPPGHHGHGHGHSHKHKPFPSFPSRFPMKTASSNVHRQRVRPPHPPGRPHPGKSFRPPVFFKAPQHMKHSHGPPSGPSGPPPSGPSPAASAGPTMGYYTGPPEHFQQSEIPMEATRIPVTEPSNTFIVPSKEFPLTFPSVPHFSSNSIDGMPPPPDNIGLITSPGFPQGNDSEHGWTAPNYKGWIPVARPASYYLDRERQKFHEQQPQPSAPVTVSFSHMPPTGSSSSSTTEPYRDYGNKYQNMMLNTLFRDNVSHIKPPHPVKLKPEFSEDHKSVLIPIPDEEGQQIRVPASIFYDEFGREPSEFNEIFSSGNGGQQRPPMSFAHHNHGIRPYPHPANHNFEARPHDGPPRGQASPPPPPPPTPNSHDLHTNTNSNLESSHSEEAPVRKPFPKFKATFTPPSNDSSVIGESLAAAGSNEGGSESERPNLVHRYKSKRPGFQRPRKPSSEDVDEFGPPKVSANPTQQLSIKEKINRGRLRLRGRRPDSSQQTTSTEESNQGNQNAGQEQASSEGPAPGSGSGSNNNNNNGPNNDIPINIISSEDNVNRPPGPSYTTINEQPQSEFSGSGSSNRNVSNLNFPSPPPLYGGGFYNQGHPMSPPPPFYESAGPQYVSVNDNNNFAGPSGSGRPGNARPADHRPPQGPNHVPRAGPHKKKKVKPGHEEFRHPQHPVKKPVYQEHTTIRNTNVPHHPPTAQDGNNNFQNYAPPRPQQHGRPQPPPPPPQPVPQSQPFYFPNEFTEMTQNDGHPSVSFMTMPGSQPNVIRHQFEFQQQSQQHPPQHHQPQGSPQPYPVNIIGPSPQTFNRHMPPLPPQHNFHSGPPGPRPGPTGPNKLRAETTTVRSPNFNVQFGHQYPSSGEPFPRNPNIFPPPRQETRNVRHPQGGRPPAPVPLPAPPSGGGPQPFNPDPNFYESSEQYEKVPFEFINHLKPILMDNNQNPQAGPSTYFSSSARPILSPVPSGSSPGGVIRHTHQSPDIMPPSQYFDDFLKPFEENLAQSSTERLPSTTLYPATGTSGSSETTAFARPMGPKPNTAPLYHDHHKAPSMNFAHFVRTHPPRGPPPPPPHSMHVHHEHQVGRPPLLHSDFTPSRPHYQKEQFVEEGPVFTEGISSNPVFNIAPIQDFSVNSLTPIQDFDIKEFTSPPATTAPSRPHFSKQRPVTRPAADTPSVASIKTSTPYASPLTAPADSELVIPEVEITEAPKRDSAVIRATHRPIYYRKRTESLPVISSTTHRPSFHSPASSSSHATSTESTPFSEAQTSPLTSDLGDHRSTEHHEHSHASHSSEVGSHEIEFSKPIIISSSEVTKSVSSEPRDPDHQDETSIPSSLRTRLTSTTRLATTTTTENPTEPVSFSPKRFLKRRRQGYNEAGTQAGRKKFFSAKVNRNNSHSEEENTSSTLAATRLRHRQFVPASNSNDSESQEPPVTTHRPFRRHRPFAPSSSGSASGSGEDMVVTQAHSYTRHRILPRVKNVSAARLGVPAAEDSKPGKRVLATSSSVEGDGTSPIRIIKRRKSTTASTSLEEMRFTTPESQVTYGESQWFRLDKAGSGTPAHEINQDHHEERSASALHASNEQDDEKEKRAKENDNHVNNADSGVKVVVSMSKSSSSSSSSNNQDNDAPSSHSLPSSIETHQAFPTTVQFSPKKRYHFKKPQHFNPYPSAPSASALTSETDASPEQMPQPATLVQLQAPRSLDFDPVGLSTPALSSVSVESSASTEASSSGASSATTPQDLTSASAQQSSEETVHTSPLPSTSTPAEA